MTVFELQLSPERHASLVGACNVRKRQATQHDDFNDLGATFKENSMWLDPIKVPVRLWLALASVLSVAMHQSWGEDKMYFKRRLSCLKRSLREDAVTRLGRMSA